MSVKSCSLNIDENKHENATRGTPMFPCSGYITEVGEAIIPWHWHEEIELLVVCRGTLKLELIGQCYYIKQGEGAFINTSVLQAGTNAENENCVLKSFVFHSSIISGMLESAFEQHYVRPLMECSNILGIHFKSDTPWHMEAVQYILEAFEYYQSEAFGYELLIREKLSRVWLLIVSNNRDLLSEQQISHENDSRRLKSMITFIHNNFAERIELRHIAKSASISERECLRCFKRNIAVSPMKYLLKHRISVAAGMLASSDMSITEICNRTGFESSSYFSLIFKKLISMTPREYRVFQKSKANHQKSVQHL